MYKRINEEVYERKVYLQQKMMKEDLLRELKDAFDDAYE